MGEWTKERYESFRKELFAQAEPEFARFQAKLLRSDLPVIGLRTPFLRKTAKELVKDDGEAFLRFCGRDTYEERLLYGLVAAALPVPYEAFLGYCDVYVEDVVENWAHCDVFCSSLKKRLKGHEADFFGYIQKYLASESSWAVRVGLVVMLEYYLTADNLRESLRRTGVGFLLCTHGAGVAFGNSLGKRSADNAGNAGESSPGGMDLPEICAEGMRILSGNVGR